MEPTLPIIGKSEAIQQVFYLISKVAATDANILLLGENGTGKELVARALHQASRRSTQAFVGVDMGAIAETLFESELFGHVKGAFTDARQDRIGRFEEAHNGTLFLDEIGNLSFPLQAKLLSALQQRSITRLGSNHSIQVNIRLISATNLPIREQVAARAFRQDLLYRINTVEIQLPPLRERREDIPLLADHFINIYGRQYQKEVSSLSRAALQKLREYPWPGNVRELQHAIERAVIMTASSFLQPKDFSLQPDISSSAQFQFPTHKLLEVEKYLVEKVLLKHNFNISRAARELGITRSSLYRRMEKFGFQPNDTIT